MEEYYFEIGYDITGRRILMDAITILLLIYLMIYQKKKHLIKSRADNFG